MHKVGDCFFCPLTNKFLTIDTIQGDLITFLFDKLGPSALMHGQMWESSLTMYLERKTYIKLKENSEKERLLIKLKYGS